MDIGDRRLGDRRDHLAGGDDTEKEMVMRKTLASVLAVVMVSVVSAGVREDAPEKVKTFVAKCMQAKPEHIKAAKASLEQCRKDLVSARLAKVDRKLNGPKSENGRMWFPSPEAKQAKVAEAEHAFSQAQGRLAELAKPDGFEPVELSFEPKVGEIGRLGLINVVQVVQGEGVIAVQKMHGVEYRGYSNAGQMLTRPKTYTGTPIWISDAVEGLVDGRNTRIDRVYEVVGTKTYESEAGTVTVPELRPLDLSQFITSE